MGIVDRKVSWSLISVTGKVNVTNRIKTQLFLFLVPYLILWTIVPQKFNISALTMTWIVQ